jgi:hypothetical protein
VVIYRPVTVEARVRSPVTSCRICVRQSGTETGVRRSNPLLPRHCHSTNAQYYLIHLSPALRVKWVPVTTAWRVLRLRMEERPPYMERIYWISSRGQSTRGGPPACGLGEVLTTPRRKKKFMLRNTLQSLRTGLILGTGTGGGLL